MTMSADEKIIAYDALLKKWQQRINLVAKSTLDDSRIRHFDDSAQILPMIPAHAKTIYDLGSGAGFPGLVLAIKRPDISFHLIESNQKKTNFLSNVARELDLNNVTFHTNRIEEMAQTLATPDAITARALASMKDIFDMTWPWAEQRPELRYILLKGRTAKQEISDALKFYSFEHHSAPSSTEQEAAVLRIQNVQKK